MIWNNTRVSTTFYNQFVIWAVVTVVRTWKRLWISQQKVLNINKWGSISIHKKYLESDKIRIFIKPCVYLWGNHYTWWRWLWALVSNLLNSNPDVNTSELFELRNLFTCLYFDFLNDYIWVKNSIYFKIINGLNKLIHMKVLRIMPGTWWVLSKH